MWLEKEAHQYQMNPLKPYEDWDFLQRKLCCAFSGIARAPSITKFFRRIKT